MSSFDLILKNGTVFTPEATEITDIAVKDGKIVDFKVMVRPLQAVNKVHQKMQEALDAFKNN